MTDRPQHAWPVTLLPALDLARPGGTFGRTGDAVESSQYDTVDYYLSVKHSFTIDGAVDHTGVDKYAAQTDVKMKAIF